MMDDPYDDFDPRNYVYGADEEAEEVVYPEELGATKIETNVYERKLSLNLSQDVNHSNFQVYPEELGSTNNETSVYEQKLSLNLSQDVNHSNFQASQQHLPASSLQPRRARKRQRAQPIPRQSHNQYDDSQAQDYSGNEEEDIFASVRSFLKNQQAPDIPCVAKGAIPTPEVNATNDASSSVPDSQVANADTMTEVVAQQEKQDPVDEEKVKEPDTNPLYARKMHGFNPEHQATANKSYSPFSLFETSSMGARIEQQFDRQRLIQSKLESRKETARPQEPSLLYAKEHQQSRSITAELERTRERFHGNKDRWKPVVHSKEQRSSVRGQRMSSIQTSKSKDGKEHREMGAGSINELRPQYWESSSSRADRSGENRQGRRNGATKLLRAQQLAQATRPRARHTNTPRNAVSHTPRTGRSIIGHAEPQSSQSPRPQHTAWQPMAKGADISFTPVFLSASKSSNDSLGPDHDDVEMPMPSDRDQIHTPLNQGYSEGSAVFSGGSSGGISNSETPRRKRSVRRRKIKAGPLMSLLRSIRGNVEGDCIRFRSGTYPFDESRRFDMNDPRNRAGSFMDVTIVGKPVSWDSKYQMLTVLAFVHTHVVKEDANRPDTTSSIGNDDQQTTNSANGGRPFYAWVCFTFDTARERQIQQWTQIRIYNAILIPSRELVEVPACCRLHKMENQICSRVAVCTKLCESYPASLPRLEGVCIQNNNDG